MTPLNYKLRPTCFKCEHSDAMAKSGMDLTCLEYDEAIRSNGYCDVYLERVTPKNYEVKTPKVCFVCEYCNRTTTKCTKWPQSAFSPIGCCEDWEMLAS